MTDLEFADRIREFRADKKDGLQRMREFLRQPGHLDRLYDLALKGAGKPKREPRRKARSSLPDAFPDAQQIDRAKGFWAMSKRHDLVTDVLNQAEAFRDFHIGRGTLAADWPATWGTWMRNALQRNRQPWGQQTASVQPASLSDWKYRVSTFWHGDDEHGVAPGYWNATWGPKPGEPGCMAPN